MKKLLVIVAVLALAGTAFAADLNDGLTKQIWGQARGHSVITDNSVLMRIWYIGTGNGQIGVSTNSVNLYDNGVLTQNDIATYPTVQNQVDRINDTTSFRAVVGPDAWGGLILDSVKKHPVFTTTTTLGTSRIAPSYVYLDGISRQLMAGVEATEGKYTRIKKITSSYDITEAGGSGVVTVLVYDGDTIVWREATTTGAYNSTTGHRASPNTIDFVNYTDKGLAGGMGKSLVAVVSGSTATLNGASDYASDHNISILYDQF